MALVGNLRLWTVQELVSSVLLCNRKSIQDETVRKVCENFQYLDMGIFVHILSGRIRMSIFGEGVMAGGGKKPTPLSVSTNGTWSIAGGYSPVNVNVPASAVTSGTKVITANGDYDVTEFKNVSVIIGNFASTSPIEGLSYVDGLPNDWNTMKEIAKIISEASNSINANTTGSIYVNKGALAYKITPGNTINVTSQIGTHAYAVMGFNNFALANQGNYGGRHTTAGLTFGAADCVG